MSFFRKIQNTETDRSSGEHAPVAAEGFSDGVGMPKPYKPEEFVPVNQAPLVRRPAFRAERDTSTEINKALEEILWIVKDSLDVHSVFLFWVNRNKKQFILESSISDSKFFTDQERIPFGDRNLLQLVADGRKPVLRFRFTPEEAADQAIYYQYPEKIMSFVGVPVFFGEEVCAVFGTDSLKADYFGGEEMVVLNRLASMVSHLVYIYSSKDDLEFTGEASRQTSLYMIELGRERDVNGIIARLADYTSRLMEFSYGALACFDESGRLSVMRVMNTTNDSYVAEETEIALDHSVIGGVMRSLRPVVLKSTEASLDGRFRFHPEENISANNSLVAVPVYSNHKCYGAILLEHEVRGWFTSAHVEALEQLGYITGLAMENVLLTQQVEHQAIYDEVTGLYHGRFFREQVEVELIRAARVGYECCFLLFEIDHYQSIVNDHGMLLADEALRHLAKVLNINLRNYDWLGRTEGGRFGALMVHTDANTAYIIAGKIRESLASTPVRFDRTEIALTISVGLARLKRDMATADYMFDAATAALERAQEQGGNNIKTT